jgi:hypothetical protein
MEEHIKQIEAAIEVNRAIKTRTPWLETSLGHLRAAVEHLRQHVAYKPEATGTVPKPAAENATK